MARRKISKEEDEYDMAIADRVDAELKKEGSHPIPYKEVIAKIEARLKAEENMIEEKGQDMGRDGRVDRANVEYDKARQPDAVPKGPDTPITKESRIDDGYTGKETEPEMTTDLLEVHLDGVGIISFTKSNRARIRKNFGSTFFLDGSTIHGSLFVNIRGGKGIYSVQFVDIKTNRFVTTKITGMTGNEAAIQAIQVGWDEFRKILSRQGEKE